MKNRLYQCIWLFIFFLFFCSMARGASTSLPPGKEPISVGVGLYLNDVLSINEKSESMLFDAQLTLRWKDTRLKPGDYNTQATQDLLSTIWHPQIELVGAQGARTNRILHLNIDKNGIVTWKEQFEASSSIRMNLHQFPFDEQTLRIRLEPFVEDASRVQLHPLKEYSGIKPFAYLKGWYSISSDVQVVRVKNPIEHRLFSQFILNMHYQRITKYYIYQLFVPIFLIVLLSFSGFWMLKSPLVNRAAISLTAVLTIVVFEWRVLSKLPRVNYHTFVDVFMLVSFIIAVSTVPALIFLESTEEKPRHQFWIRLFRIGYPVLYLVSVCFVALIYFL